MHCTKICMLSRTGRTREFAGVIEPSKHQICLTKETDRRVLIPLYSWESCLVRSQIYRCISYDSRITSNSAFQELDAPCSLLGFPNSMRKALRKSKFKPKARAQYWVLFALIDKRVGSANDNLLLNWIRLSTWYISLWWREFRNEKSPYTVHSPFTFYQHMIDCRCFFLHFESWWAGGRDV
jgi:hypothetical protein